MRVLKRAGQWHWWCPDRMGGDWWSEWEHAIYFARWHAKKAHGE